MADFVLTQTDAQVQSVLNDAQDAQGAGAQTTLTTEYVMLKDTNGRYHKILKSSLTEACRNVLASLLVNNDKGTTISQIAAIASGDFGSITPANLASVLGGTTTAIESNANIKNYMTYGRFTCASNTVAATLTGLPTGYGSGGFVLFVLPSSQPGSNFRIQVLVNYLADYIIIRAHQSGAWGAWRQITAASLT